MLIEDASASSVLALVFSCPYRNSPGLGLVSRFSIIVRVNVVLNRTVVDSD